MQFPHSHQGLSIFSPLRLVSQILISAHKRLFRGEGWHDHGCGHGRGGQQGHQDNNSDEIQCTGGTEQELWMINRGRFETHWKGSPISYHGTETSQPGITRAWATGQA